jgi:hypothetical protein
MNRTSLRSLAACVLFGGVVVAGCGGGDQTPDLSTLLGDSGTASSSSGSGRDSGGGYEYDSGSGYQYDSGGGGNEDTGTSSGSSGGGTCGSCTTDSECQSACPAVQGGGTNCCDVGSGVCYATTQTTCPAPSDGGAE